MNANIVNIRGARLEKEMATATANDVGPLGFENPMGTDGFEFVEYAAPDPELLRSLFAKMGFPAVARHKR
jgi:4-hydroxyphenylpyruvate dioxygenase